ncbi:MAG: asparaginase domain-containing protein, partial [Pseudomonadota bacterium]
MAQVEIIHTGGTIGMVRGENGFRPQAGLLEKSASDLFRARNISVNIQLITPLIDSANATPADWNRITQTVVEAAQNSDGVIVTHGTDTMGFAAAALTLALEGCPVAVILTGAMVPLSEPGSDGLGNLSFALEA